MKIAAQSIAQHSTAQHRTIQYNTCDGNNNQQQNSFQYFKHYLLSLRNQGLVSHFILQERELTLQRFNSCGQAQNIKYEIKFSIKHIIPNVGRLFVEARCRGRGRRRKEKEYVVEEDDDEVNVISFHISHYKMQHASLMEGV